MSENKDKKMDSVRNFLENPIWPDTLNAGVTYSVQTDDSDGDPELGFQMVAFSEDGDAHIRVLRPKLGDSCRFRTLIGGGKSPHVRAELIVLAEAIRIDTQEGGELCQL